MSSSMSFGLALALAYVIWTLIIQDDSMAMCLERYSQQTCNHMLD